MTTVPCRCGKLSACGQPAPSQVVAIVRQSCSALAVVATAQYLTAWVRVVIAVSYVLFFSLPGRLRIIAARPPGRPADSPDQSQVAPHALCAIMPAGSIILAMFNVQLPLPYRSTWQRSIFLLVGPNDAMCIVDVCVLGQFPLLQLVLLVLVALLGAPSLLH